jgi:hypothetical protein
MVAIFQSALAVRPLFVVLIQLLPLIPLPLVLGLELWAVSKYEFSRVGAMAFRVAYLVAVFVSCYVSYLLAVICWTARL